MEVIIVTKNLTNVICLIATLFSKSFLSLVCFTYKAVREWTTIYFDAHTITVRSTVFAVVAEMWLNLKERYFAPSVDKSNNEAAAEEEREYDCEEDGVNYLHRRFPDYQGFKVGRMDAGKTDTRQECQKRCAETEHCKFFTWHKENDNFKKECALSQTYSWKAGNHTTVSGPRECPKKWFYFKKIYEAGACV